MRSLILSLLMVVILSLLSPAIAQAADESLPRYSLPLGRKLTYSTKSESKDTAGNDSSMGEHGTWQLTVTRQNPDGSARVLIRIASAFSQTFSGQSHSQPERVMIGYADIFPDGRVVQDARMAMQLNPSAVFPRLPADAVAIKTGWSDVNEAKQETVKFSASQPPAAGSEFVFTGNEESPLNKIYLSSTSYTHHFDRDKGLVTLAESQMTQDYGFHSKGSGATKLIKEETIAPAELSQMAGEFDALFKARDAYEQKMREIAEHPQDADKIIADAKAILENASKQTNSEVVNAEVAKILEQHDDYAKYEKQSAAKIAQVLNKPAADFSTTDVDGKPHTLADYKGKVIVMDFWYRGCGWCMYAMPQVKQLAADFKDKPVAVLGMNTDTDPADAKFVIDAMQLNYPTLKAQGLPDKFGVEAFPTLIVIDAQGVIRDYHSGYSPTLRQDIGKKIQSLLDSKIEKAAG